MNNFPLHTQNPLTPPILRKIKHFGLKDSSGEMSLVKSTPRYFIGDDTRICRALQAGATGFVSAGANALPELFVSMEACAGAHDWREAQALQSKVSELIVRLGNNQIPAIKRLVQARIENYPTAVRPPLAALLLNDADSADLDNDQAGSVAGVGTNL